MVSVHGSLVQAYFIPQIHRNLGFGANPQPQCLRNIHTSWLRLQNLDISVYITVYKISSVETIILSLFVNVCLKALTVNCKVQSLPVVSQDPKAPGSPTSLRVSPAGACDDLDMETEEEDELRTRGYSSLMSRVLCIVSGLRTLLGQMLLRLCFNLCFYLQVSLD